MSKLHNYKTFNQNESQDWTAIEYLKLNPTKRTLCTLLSIASLGFFLLLRRWLVTLERLPFDQTDPRLATHVFVTSADGAQTLVEVSPSSTFLFRHQLYVYSSADEGFMPLSYEFRPPAAETGLSVAEHEAAQALFGPCVIDIPQPSVFNLFVTEFLHPFFVFQVLSVFLWFYEAYYLYASAILVLSLSSLASSVQETYCNLKSIRNMAHYVCPVQVLRGEWQHVQSVDLVPGDVFRIPTKLPLPCDCMLLTGSCLVDESMLTGESQPVLKEAYSPYACEKKSVLCSGTTSIHNQGECLGQVTATGFYTAKGALVKSILYPKPSKFKFYSDSFKYIAAMSVLAVLGFLWCLASFIEEGLNPLDILINSLDLITIIVPPALPLAMTVGIAVAVGRLSKTGVTCISPTSINAAGRVAAVAFDKTGTLTEDNMQLKGVWDLEQGKFVHSVEHASYTFQENLAICHSLALVDGQLVGDPQELAVFNSSPWTPETSATSRFVARLGAREVSILHLFHFSPVTKRMGVICQADSVSFHVKGAPEEVLKLCSNLSPAVSTLVRNYSRQGLRVLCCAYKPLQPNQVTESLATLEHDLVLLGLILLENPVKAQASEVVKTLITSEIHCVISTGDSLLTAIAAAKQSGILPHSELVDTGSLQYGNARWENEEGEAISQLKHSLAITGELLEHLVTTNDPQLNEVMKRCKVFGRMSPQQKVVLVKELQKSEQLVAMVGDGANDCGALKAADVGVSLSEAESSIAAPFTGKTIDSVVTVLREGRAALVTSFQSFKFITLYSMIQFACVNTLFLLHNNMLDYQYLFQDLCIILPLALFMAYTEAAPTLAKELPPGTLISVSVLSSIVGQTCLLALGQLAGFLLVASESWYQAAETSVEAPGPSMDNTVLFILSSFQLVLVCACFSIGHPFRKPAHSNLWFTGCCILLLVFLTYVTICPDPVTIAFFELETFPKTFRLTVLSVVAVTAGVMFIYEQTGVPNIEVVWSKITKTH